LISAFNPAAAFFAGMIEKKKRINFGPKTSMYEESAVTYKFYKEYNETGNLMLLEITNKFFNC